MGRIGNLDKSVPVVWVKNKNDDLIQDIIMVCDSMYSALKIAEEFNREVERSNGTVFYWAGMLALNTWNCV
jgi:myosin-crossreactive antigen